MFCGSMEDLCQVVGVLMRLRPRLVNKSMQGIPGSSSPPSFPLSSPFLFASFNKVSIDVTQISVTQFGSDHTSPAEGESSEHESNEVSTTKKEERRTRARKGRKLRREERNENKSGDIYWQKKLTKL